MRLVMAAHDRMGWNQLVALNSYNDKVRRIRRLLHDGMSPKFMRVSAIAPMLYKAPQNIFIL